jgi:hypothetical protein
MSLHDSIRFPLHLAAVVVASVLLFSCADAPDGIKTASGSTVQWSIPDTVAVLVSGTPSAREVHWYSLTPDQKSWLAEHGFERIDARPSDAKTKQLWLERLRTLRGLIGREHIPEAREAVVRELAIEAVGSNTHLGLDISDGFDVDRFQERLEQKLELEDPTREEVKATIDTFEAALDEYEEQRVFGHVSYARRE